MSPARPFAPPGAEIVLLLPRGGRRPVFEQWGASGPAVAYQSALLCRLYPPGGTEVLSAPQPVEAVTDRVTETNDRGGVAIWKLGEQGRL